MAAPSAVLFWNGVALQRNIDDHTLPNEFRRAPGPTASAFMLAVVHVAIGDACAGVAGSGYGHLRVAGSPPPGADRRAWIGGAAFGALAFIYNDGPQSDSLGTARANFFSAIGLPPVPPPPGWDEGVKLGTAVAQALWNRVKVVEGIGPDNYIPLPGEHNVDPENPCQGFYGVLWDSKIPPIVSQTNPAKPPAPPALASARYAAAWKEVFVEGNRFAVLDYDRKIVVDSPEEIALFWAYDGPRGIGTPPRLYNQHVIAIAKKDGLRDDGADDLKWAQLLGRCNVALADAGRVCWRAKYAHRIWRPVRGLRNVDKVPLPAALLTDAAWVPYGSPRTNRPISPPAPPELPQFTPQFPAYPSGHATFGAACFDVLRRWREDEGFGGPDGDTLADIKLRSDELNDTLMTPTRDHVRPNVKRPLRERSFSSLGAVIKENGQSRIYQGVHWQFDSEEGIALGEKVAKAVHQRAYV